METTPAELKSDHVALRFTADQSGLVTFEDAAHRATGHSAYVDYFATTRRMALVGPGPMSVSMTAPDEKGGLKRIDGVRLDPVINDDATIIHASGPSVLTSISAPDESAATGHAFKVSSTDQADFTIENKNGNVTNALRQAIFQGNVQIEDTGGTLQGGYVRADFIGTSDQPSVLSRLIVQDHAVANSAESGHLAADHLDVAFKPGEKGRNADPTQLTAEGNVKLDKAGTSLSTDFLDATLARSAKGSIDVTAATARGSVHYADKTQNVSTDCDLLQADFSPNAAAPDGHRQIVDLSGPKTILREADQTTITGTQMRLDGVGQRLEVFGPGEFDSHDAKRGSSGLTTIHATWTVGMTFDDLAGNVQCNGNVISDSTSDSLQRDHLEAERVTLSITPHRPASGTPDLDAGKKDKERKLLRAVALGSVLDREGGTNAHAESRTYVADEGAGAEGGQRLI
jgi:lipopolysaccharide export system protein LptA